MQDRPNIVYIFTDQQSADAMSCTGNQLVSTPSMDRLATKGTRFENAYCSYPLCVPSRMSMITGRMPHELGIFANCHPTDDDLQAPVLGRLFRDAGYETHWTGKWHLTIPQGETERHGFEGIDFGGGYGDTDDRKAEAACEFLRREHPEPFLLVCSLNNPHDCCEWSRGNPLRMGPLPPVPEDADLPPLPQNWEIPTGEPDYLRDFARAYDRVFPAMQWSDVEARRYLWGYYRLVEMGDRAVGRILDAIEETRHGDRTVVVFSSDHGDGASRHRWNQKFSLYDESARVPLIIAAPFVGDGMGRPRVEKQPVSAGLDLLPTLCDFAGIDFPRKLRGRSVRPIIDGKQMPRPREYVVAETSFSMWAAVGEDLWPKARMVRTTDYKYIVYDTGERREQLIALDRDPGETRNVASEHQYRSVLQDHRAFLRHWCEATDDSFSVPNYRKSYVVAQSQNGHAGQDSTKLRAKHGDNDYSQAADGAVDPVEPQKKRNCGIAENRNF